MCVYLSVLPSVSANSNTGRHGFSDQHYFPSRPAALKHVFYHFRQSGQGLLPLPFSVIHNGHTAMCRVTYAENKEGLKVRRIKKGKRKKCHNLQHNIQNFYQPQQFYLGNRVCVCKRATCFDLGQVILNLIVVKTHLRKTVYTQFDCLECRILKNHEQVKSFVQTQVFVRTAVVPYRLFVPIVITHMKEELFFFFLVWLNQKLRCIRFLTLFLYLTL